MYRVPARPHRRHARARGLARTGDPRSLPSAPVRSLASRMAYTDHEYACTMSHTVKDGARELVVANLLRVHDWPAAPRCGTRRSGIPSRPASLWAASRNLPHGTPRRS
eukprot:1738519-Prymnesium_polylepis.2